MEPINEKPVIYVSGDDDLRTVLSCFKINKISHVPVVSNGKINGMVTKTDVVEHLYGILPDQGSETLESLCKSILVKELMIQPVVEADVNESEEAIIEKILNHEVGSVILKENGKMVGIVTEQDMLRYLARSKDEDVSASEALGYQVVKWLDDHGAFRISKMLSDIGI